jgi:FXSXX-COOH protein
LVDLTSADFEQLATALSERGRGDSVLAYSLRRVLREARNPTNPIAGFRAAV